MSSFKAPERRIVWRMYEEYTPPHKIVQIFKKNKSSVVWLIANVKKKGPGYLKASTIKYQKPKKITTRSERWLVRFAWNQRSANVCKIHDTLSFYLKVSVSHRAIRIFLKWKSYWSRVAWEKSFRSMKNRIRRLQFAWQCWRKRIGVQKHIVYQM